MHKTFVWFKFLIIYPIVIAVSTLLISYFVINILTTPSNNRNWSNDQAVLPYADIQKNLVTIHNIRNFSYTSTDNYTSYYYDKTFDINQLKKVWYVVEPFDGIPGSAHTFLSFEFEGDQFVSISVEIRKEKGETYSPILGLFNQYEIMYVIADEKDAIKLRSNYRNDPVYVYPAKGSIEKSQTLFLDMIKRANDLKQSPEFYNTITNNCTTNIVNHINTITPNRVPLLNISLLLPENSDKLAYDLGLIDTDLFFQETREKYYINERAHKYADDINFSRKIRE